MDVGKSKWLHASNVFFGALGGGLLLYRYGALGAAASGRRADGLFYGALVCCALAVFIQRQVRSSARWPLGLRIVVVLLGLVASGVAGVAIAPPPAWAALTDRELPGLTISLPAGEESTKGSGYSQGGIAVKSV